MRALSERVLVLGYPNLSLAVRGGCAWPRYIGRDSSAEGLAKLEKEASDPQWSWMQDKERR